ncbi:hypothetical protein T06_5546 [Trichinella sp. T6]|nr:hypothetical protein T06_5546 [Trichinella sp. T6]
MRYWLKLTSFVQYFVGLGNLGCFCENLRNVGLHNLDFYNCNSFILIKERFVDEMGSEFVCFLQ